MQGENGLTVTEGDFNKISSSAANFFDSEAAAKQKHADKQPPKPPPTKAEIEYPGIVFPPGFGPDAPDWNPNWEEVHREFSGGDEPAAPSGEGGA